MTRILARAGGLVVALVLVVLAVGGGNAFASQASKTIFYSGLGVAGANSGRDAGAYVMVHSKGVRSIFDGAEIWKGTSTCNSNRAVPRRTTRTFTRLVGYSVGRLGPAYYLQQMEQRRTVSQVRSVVLIDPGPADELGCDRRSGAGNTYATWLRQNPANRLLIITADASAADGYSGIRDTYASKLTPGTVGADVGTRVLICDAPKVKHALIDEKSRGLIGGEAQTSCPSWTRPNKYSPRSAAPPGQAPAPPGAGGSAPAVTIGQGPVAPHGYRYAIALTGFGGGALVTIVCRDSADPSGFYTFHMAMDANGNGGTSSHCYSADGPDHWVTVNGIESNRAVWGGGAPPPPPPPSTPPPPPPSTPPTTPATAQITVDNRVTNGGTQMREDTPAYLSTVTRNFCKRDGCALAGTDVGSGAVLTAECTAYGDRTTNGQDNSAIDDGNPGLYSSTRWYGIRWGDGRFGYISEVWIVSQHRGGVGLRTC